MNKVLIAGILLIVIIASSALIGYSQNWFQSTVTPQPTPSPTPTATATAQPTEGPTATTSPTATATPTSQPTTSPTAQPTTVEALDLTLEVYGNANGDDKIDANDVAYVNSIIAGTASKTQFADANYDGVVNSNDVAQINAIINGQATQINMLDGNGQNITVSLPANRIIIEYIQNAELARILELEDKIVGFDYAVDKLRSIYFPNNPDIVSVGNMNSPDYEAVLNLNPDILLTFTSATTEKASKLPGVDVVFLGLYYPNVTAPEDSKFLQGVMKAGYIFNKVPKATEYANWLLNLTSTIRAKTSTLSESQMHTVFITNSPTITTTTKAYATIDTLGQVCILAGGSNIAESLPTYLNASSVTVDAEWIIEQDPEYIFLHTVRYTFGGGTNEPSQGIDANDITSVQDCLQDYLSQPAFANLTAVKNNHVYIIAGDFRNNAMGGTLGAVYLANILYPNLFTDLNAETIHQEYITKYLRLNYNLDNSGIFLYPAITINGDPVGIPNGAA